MQAASFGGTNIDPTAWEDKKNQGESRFPAQVYTYTILLINTVYTSNQSPTIMILIMCHVLYNKNLLML